MRVRLNFRNGDKEGPLSVSREVGAIVRADSDLLRVGQFFVFNPKMKTPGDKGRKGGGGLLMSHPIRPEEVELAKVRRKGMQTHLGGPACPLTSRKIGEKGQVRCSISRYRGKGGDGGDGGKKVWEKFFPSGEVRVGSGQTERGCRGVGGLRDWGKIVLECPSQGGVSNGSNQMC